MTPSDRPVLLVSACLLGFECNHLGRSNRSAPVVALGDEYDLVPTCPEVAGGLPVPRVEAERQPGGGVRTRAGEDVTAAYEAGAAAAVEAAAGHGATGAVLKARSPSCGCHEIYDGTFSRTRVAGEGVTAEALRVAGLEVVSEDDVAAGRRPGPPRSGG